MLENLPNKLNWTVILVAIAESTMAASSWAAKIFPGLSSKLRTEMKPASQIFFSRSNATSRSSDREILYLSMENREVRYRYRQEMDELTSASSECQNYYKLSLRHCS